MNEPDAVIVLTDRGWKCENGFWSRAGLNWEGLPYLFTLDQVLKMEGLNGDHARMA